MLLARQLYETMERLDPPTDAAKPFVPWDELSWWRKEFYGLCVSDLLQDRALVLKALTDNDVVLGRAMRREDSEGSGAAEQFDDEAMREVFRQWLAENDRILSDGDTGDVVRLYLMLRQALAKAI